MIIFEVLIGVVFDILLQIPGATLRYILAKERKNLKAYLNDANFILNYIISIIFYFSIFIIIRIYLL